MKLVLDTNVVLDLLLFEDAALDPLRIALREQRASLIAHRRSLDELHRVLLYPKFERHARRREEILRQYAEAVSPLVNVESWEQLPTGFPRCRDPDDDHFFSLAYLTQADALVSKDRQVLKLGNKVKRFGVTVVSLRELSLALERE